MDAIEFSELVKVAAEKMKDILLIVKMKKEKAKQNMIICSLS